MGGGGGRCPAIPASTAPGRGGISCRRRSGDARGGVVVGGEEGRVCLRCPAPPSATGPHPGSLSPDLRDCEPGRDGICSSLCQELASDPQAAPGCISPPERSGAGVPGVDCSLTLSPPPAPRCTRGGELGAGGLRWGEWKGRTDGCDGAMEGGMRGCRSVPGRDGRMEGWRAAAGDALGALGRGGPQPRVGAAPAPETPPPAASPIKPPWEAAAAAALPR